LDADRCGLQPCFTGMAAVRNDLLTSNPEIDMLVVKNQAHFERVMRFAHANGPKYEAWLNAMLWRLHLWGDVDGAEGLPDAPPATSWIDGVPVQWAQYVKGRVRCELYSDFACASFGWMSFVGDRRDYNGGLIYHGDQTGWRDDGGYTDPFSVELSRNLNDNPWSIHT
jgi:hypothetical protein